MSIFRSGSRVYDDLKVIVIFLWYSLHPLAIAAAF